MDVGLGLWTMRSTAAAPAAHATLYADLLDDARAAEALGFHSLWLAEHHFWYDGWCPAPLVAAAAVLAATRRLHVGTGIHLLPLYDPVRARAEVAWLARLSGGRFEHGVGLGYRAAEYDGFGLSRTVRGRRMDAGLDVLAAGDGAPAPIWVGGMAAPALQRAGRRGLNIMLPSTLRLEQAAEAIATVREHAERAGRTPGRIGIMKYTWVTDGTAADRDRAVAANRAFTREYTGSWFPLRGRPGFSAPDLLEAQARRTVDTGLFGGAEEVAEQLAGFAALGVDLAVLHLAGDGRRPRRAETMARIAEHVVPALAVAA
ncbi:MAG TPA: LLM class flavin-dependent oxidoreductase [Baekduia sp.]|uniref:LLM class flavin-dependent oxidoreductase n=1 Tax=Baekduia sp. TaxID=2600305 RepID=UPI002D776FD3|nr:LLM class flavin-dependent oxidoreductase [Baekduia sp.]HET6507001.1 LLM class flavin-dependent oxidoreductase [Baekduia sp.]